MRGKADAATSREQLMALAQRRGRTQNTLSLFAIEAATAVQNVGVRATSPLTLALLNAAVERRQPIWTRASSTERDCKRQRVSDGQKRDVVFAAKMAQSVVKAYASVNAADKEEELNDLVAAMDLACVALYVVCALEHAARLGDLVVDNLLYQVAKKYAGIPSMQKAASCVAACVHVRLWNSHAKVCTDDTTKSQLMALLGQDQVNAKIANIVTQKLEVLAEFPKPRSCHTTQFARLLLGHTNTCVTLLTAAKCHEAILSVAETTLSPWIEHLQSLLGENSKLSSSFSDRAFRILWKCAASKDGAGQKLPEAASAALRFRSTALTFLLKCSNYTSPYFIQQVHRVGVQHERATRRSQRGLQELYMFYARSANSLTQTIPDTMHVYSSDVLQWEYINWLEHFALICEVSGMHLKCAMILKSAIQYVQPFMGESIQPCLLFAVAGALFSAAGSGKREKWLMSRNESSQSPFDKRLAYDAGRVIGNLVYSPSSSTWFDHCEKAARVYLKKLEGLATCNFVSLASKDVPTFIPFLTRFLKRGSTNVFNYAISVQHSSKYQLYKQIVGSFDDMSKAMQELRAASIIKDRKSMESLLLEESRFHRMAVTLLVRCCSEDSSMVAQPGLRDLSHHVNLVRVVMDEATIDGKPSEPILQGILGELNAIARECYNCATRCYKTGNYHDTISALTGAFELAESYLEYVMCSNLAAEDIHKAHVQLKVDAIVSLLAHCFRQLEDYTKSRIFTGYSILYCGDIKEKIPQASVDKFVSCILEEVSLLGHNSELSLEQELKTFLDNAAHVFKARYIPEDQIVMLWNAFRVAFERSSANIVTSMRAGGWGGIDNTDEISVRLCCSLESYMDGVLMKLKKVPIGCESFNDILLEVSSSLAKRKQVFCGFYAHQNYNDAIQGLLLIRHALNDAVEKLQNLSDTAAADLGGVCGWRSIITIEIALMNCYAGAKQERRIVGDASICEERAIADIERCLMYWSEYGETSAFLFDGPRVICCLEAVCNTLSLVSCSVMEKAARKLLKTVQLSASVSRMCVVPPVLLSLLNVNDEDNAVIKKLSDTSLSKEFRPFQQVDDDICAARTSNFGNDGAQACQHLLFAINSLGAIRGEMKQRPTASFAKAIGMRELFVRTILSDIHFREGRSKCAIIEAKAALRICWKLAKKFGAALSSSNRGYFELPPEISGAEHQQEKSTQVLFFKALECASWDLLSAAKILLCRVASLYSLSDQPQRASYYLTEAMRLVGGLNLRLFPRKPFYEFAELELNSSHVKKAKVAISLLTPSAGSNTYSNNDVHAINAAAYTQHSCQSDFAFVEQKCNEIVQRGDVHRTEGHHQVALTCYLEAIEVLSAVAHSGTSTSKIQARAKARCWRKYTGLQGHTIDFIDSAAVEGLLTSMKMLKRSMKSCDARLERIKDMLELGRTNIRLLRSTSPRAFTSLEQTLTLLEDAFVLGDYLGIPHLSQELRTALGMAYFAEIEDNARDEVEYMDVGDRARYLAWTSSSLLANAGTNDAAEMELTTAETDSDLSTKEALVMQLERLSSASTASREQMSCKLLIGMAQTVAEKVRQLPDSWIIVSLMVSLQSELVISRIQTNGAAPISFCLPKVTWMKCMRTMDAIISESREHLSGSTAEEAGSLSTTQKKEWWSARKVLDERIEKAVSCMQETLGFWRCLLVKRTNPHDRQFAQSCWSILTSSKQGSIKLAERNQALLTAISDAHQWLSDTEVLDALKHIAAEIEVPIMPDSTAQKMLQMLRSTRQHSPEVIDSGRVGNLVKLSTERITKMKVGELKQLLATEGLRTDGFKKVLVERLTEARDAALFEKLKFQARADSQECSTILILNHQLQQFPWEAMDVMGSSSGVTRMPSLDLILKNASRASPVNCVRRNHVRFLLNPAGDLKSTQNQLGPILEGGVEAYGWEGVVGEVPDPDELREYLLAADLYIYCGHGSGEAYLHRDKVLSLQPNCSAALLFGCSSGRLEREGIFGPSGAVLAYLRAGSPAVLAMLWDVTDRDIDQLSGKVLQEWLLADHKDENSSRSLAKVLQDSRDVCKLKYLNGHAAVCYGLPLHVTSS